jgi:hypothetical protein
MRRGADDALRRRLALSRLARVRRSIAAPQARRLAARHSTPVASGRRQAPPPLQPAAFALPTDADGVPVFVRGAALPRGLADARASPRGMFVPLPEQRVRAALPARPAAVGDNPGACRLGCSAALRPLGHQRQRAMMVKRCRRPLGAGLSGRSLPPTPAVRGGLWGFGAVRETSDAPDNQADQQP